MATYCINEMNILYISLISSIALFLELPHQLLDVDNHLNILICPDIFMTLALHIEWTRRLRKKIYCPIRVRHNGVNLSEEHSPSCIIFSFSQGVYTWGTMHWWHAICCFIIYLDNCELRGLPIETQTKGCCFIDEEVITNGYYINQVLGFYQGLLLHTNDDSPTLPSPLLHGLVDVRLM